MEKRVDRTKVRDKLNFQFTITICTRKIIIYQEEIYTKKENEKDRSVWKSERKKNMRFRQKRGQKTICIHTQGIKYAVKKVTAGAEAFYGTEHRDCFI